MKSAQSLFQEDVFTSTVSKSQRACKRGMKVRVYRNLNKKEFYSILALEGEFKGKVCGYAKSVVIENVIFKVSAKSQQRVLRENRRNVHAFCEGFITDASDCVVDIDFEHEVVTYNPFKKASFYKRDDESVYMHPADKVRLQGSDAHVYL